MLRCACTIQHTYTREVRSHEAAIHETPMSKNRSKLVRLRYSRWCLLKWLDSDIPNASLSRHYVFLGSRITVSRIIITTTLLNEQSNTQSPRGQLFYLYIYTYMYIYICISMTVSRCRFTAAGLFTILTRNSVVRSSCKREQRFRWEQKLRANQTSSCCKDLCIVPSRCCRYVRDVVTRRCCDYTDINKKYFEK